MAAAVAATTMPNLSLRATPPCVRVSASLGFTCAPLSSSLFVTGTNTVIATNPRKKNVYLRSSALQTIRAKVKVEKTLPELPLSYLGKKGDVKKTTVTEVTKGKNMFLWAVSTQENFKRCAQMAAEFVADGLDTVVIISHNDAEVVMEWKKTADVKEDVRLFLDKEAEFTKAMEVELGRSQKPRGLAIYAEDGVIKFSAKRDWKGFEMLS